jgi:hypothetical protein
MNATTRTTTKPRFVCSYQGCADYDWNGRRYEVRYSTPDWVAGYWNYTPEEYERERVALVGTITCSSPRGEFPPVELEQFFPGFVRARFDISDWTVEYADGKRPETVHSTIYKCVMAKARADELTVDGYPI